MAQSGVRNEIGIQIELGEEDIGGSGPRKKPRKRSEGKSAI